MMTTITKNGDRSLKNLTEFLTIRILIYIKYIPELSTLNFSACDVLNECYKSFWPTPGICLKIKRTR